MDEAEKYFIFVGLGNPGKQYEVTRHNIGDLVVKAFASKMQWEFKIDKRHSAYVARGHVDGTMIHLLLPTTYMNLSGISVKAYLDFLKLNVTRLIVVADDKDLPFGHIRLKEMGSSGGHNGLKSIETSLGTTHYKRLRMGIGHPGEKILADYVLEDFNQEELTQLGAFVDRGAEVLRSLIKQSVCQVMNAVNIKSVNKHPKLGLGE